MLQEQSQPQAQAYEDAAQDQPQPPSSVDVLVQEGLEAAAAEMGLDWVVV